MKKFPNKIIDGLKNPPVWGKVVNFISTIAFIVVTLYLLTVKDSSPVISAISYAVFALSALSLAYTVYLVIITAPSIKRNIISSLEKCEFTDRLLKNYDFRTVIFTIGSFAMSVIFGAFNAYMGIKNLSVWYGALAFYYISLAFIRGGVLGHYKKNADKSNEENELQSQLSKAKIYRNSGITLLVLNAALSFAVVQMIVSDAHFSYAGWTIFAYAAYAFYKISMAIVNLVRAHKNKDLTIRAIRDINLTDATVSILALQTALLTTFSDESVNIGTANAITGSVVCVIAIGLGIYMIVSAHKNIKTLNKEIDSNER